MPGAIVAGREGRLLMMLARGIIKGVINGLCGCGGRGCGGMMLGWVSFGMFG